ncbi:type II secretion system F family protein [Nocardioides lianchengensis]|uniref:Tight adherence protein B n=1 Tax=Nocardioides lianchengensis TaxID=1045774 RepID=A0A1G6PX84_9ACTN|nr:type II secretion system F family protein [Nocardioides lianchengensis]NYG12000.1 tight adherence protein B [Nocardioides lianchengensis]SDC84264.1 tight adherence protein B [Nocardioides lianchengensis]
MTAVAVLAAALAAGLLVGRPARLPRPPDRRPGVRTLLPLGVLPAVVLVAGASPRVLALAVVASAAWFAGAALWRQRGARLAAERTAVRVLETCEQLAGDLGVGQPPGPALSRAAAGWPELDPVARAFTVGADVPGAWREVAGRPGAGDLRHLAAAWQVSHRTGQGLAEAVDRVAERLRAGQATRRVVRGELASARSTARLVAGLPVVALLMGSGAGGDPLGFLLGEPVGLACLAGGLGFGVAGLAWIEALARDVDRVG